MIWQQTKLMKRTICDRFCLLKPEAKAFIQNEPTTVTPASPVISEKAFPEGSIFQFGSFNLVVRFDSRRDKERVLLL
jgi:hypothetical protein